MKFSRAGSKTKSQKTPISETATSQNIISKEKDTKSEYCMKEQHGADVDFSNLVQMAKEESRKEEEQRQKTEIIHESRLDQLLFSNEFVCKSVSPDGNCFFESSVMALEEKFDTLQLRNLICDHLEQNVEEYIGFLKNKSTSQDDLTFLKEYFKEVDVLRQDGYWSNRAGDFLALALANWSHRPVSIFQAGQTSQ